MPDKKALRNLIRENLDNIAVGINAALRGKGLRAIEPVLARVGRGSVLPHWYARLKENGTLPNLDGKTVGSVIEMLLVAVLETKTFRNLGVPPLRINPARGVDLPDLDLGVKSPSQNYCTSEPFFSAYERLLGSEHDMVVLLTDYQIAKSRPPLQLQIIKWRYLSGTQVADENLCRTARGVRTWLATENEAWAKKVFRFLAYVNQSDWLAKQLLKMVEVLRSEDGICSLVNESLADFEKKNKEALRRDKALIPNADLDSLKRILDISPLRLGVIDAAENWVLETQKESGRAPNDNEWQRLMSGPLDGLVGMSFALQWRYNFGRLFNGNLAETNDGGDDDCP